MRYCLKCVYPEIAVNSIFDDNGICSGCRSEEEFDAISEESWKEREKKFVSILEERNKRKQSNYDCVIPVSGGKDSYWQVHLVKEVYGFNPLLVTYHGNNFSPEGQENLLRMRDVFNVDHLIFGAGVETLIKLNRLGFKTLGDMNWHNHAGIFTYPMNIAVKFKIPTVVWGETSWDIAGMFSPDDYVRYNKRVIIEHNLRGYTWKDFVDKEGLEEKDMIWLKMPSDEEFVEAGTEGIYSGNFFHWEPYKQVEFIKEKYNWEESRLPFERTYRTISNLDDMHENGIHDYMKYIKFGYGRATDHASKDIRLGSKYMNMTRRKAIEMVKKYDHVKPRRDLERWLEYVDMTEEEFDNIADTFRDPRVWSKDPNGNWIKDNIWDFEIREGR